MSAPRRPNAAPTRTRVARRALALLALAAVVLTVVGTDPGAAQQRRIVVVGDSVILGAQSAMVGAFQNLGWAVTFDAAVSRSTAAGGEAIESHRAELTDTLVINLGANDAGNTGAYRARVEQILASTAGVPHVYWLTIREVRDYYPAANQAVREVAAAHPNVTVLDWNAASAGEGLTSSDGLHLTGAGAAAMTDLVTAAVFGAAPPMAAAPPAPAPPPPTEPPPTAPPETAPPETAPPVTAPPTTTSTVPPTTATLTPSSGGASDARRSSATDEVAAAATGGSSGWLLGGIAAVVVLLALAAAAVGGWTLVSTRDGRAQEDPDMNAAPPPDLAQEEEEHVQQS